MANENDFLIDDFGISDTQELSSISELDSLLTGEPVDVELVTEEDAAKTETTVEPEVVITDEDILGAEEEKPIPVSDVIENEEEEEEIDEDVHIEDQYQKIGNEFVKMGLIELEEGEEAIFASEKDLKERLDIEQRKGANRQLTNFLSKFGDKYLNAFDSIFVKGVDPEQYFALSKVEDDITSLDMEQEPNQKSVIARYYREYLGYSDERANKMIDMLAEKGELDSEATMAYDKIVQDTHRKIEQAEQERTQITYQKQQQQAFYNHNVTTFLQEKLKEKDLGGIPLTEKTAQTALQNLTDKPYKVTSTGELISDFEYFLMSLKDPKNIEIALKIELLRQNNFDFSKIKQKAVTEETNELFQSLMTKNKQNKRSNNQAKRSDNFQI